MIHASLSFLTRELNSFIRLKDPLQTAGGSNSLVVLSSIVDQENKLFINNDAVLLTLVNTEEETVGKAQLPYHRSPDDILHIENPEIKLNLYLLFSAHGTDGNGGMPAYERALKLLDEVVLFFQYRNVFRGTDQPGLQAAGIDKLIMDPVSLSFEQQNHLWAALGAKYLPSVLYKCRMLTFRHQVVSPEGTLIRDIETIKTNLS